MNGEPGGTWKKEKRPTSRGKPSLWNRRSRTVTQGISLESPPPHRTSYRRRGVSVVGWVVRVRVGQTRPGSTFGVDPRPPIPTPISPSQGSVTDRLQVSSSFLSSDPTRGHPRVPKEHWSRARGTGEPSLTKTVSFPYPVPRRVPYTLGRCKYVPCVLVCVCTCV